MASTFVNIAYETVLKGVEKLLETEFKNEAIVYLSPVYEDNPSRVSIRLWLNPLTHITRFAGNAGVSKRYPVEVMLYVPVGQRSKRKDQKHFTDLTERNQRVLENNADYKVSTNYQWHDGVAELTDFNPSRNADFDPEPKVMNMALVNYEVTVTEIYA